MDVISRIAVFITPVLFILLSWFLKRHVDKTDKSIESAETAAEETSKIVVNNIAEFKADIKIISSKMEDANERYDHFAHIVSVNLAETRKLYQSQQNTVLDSTAKLIDQYRELKRITENIVAEVRKLSESVDKHAGSLSAAGQVMKAHQAHLVVLDQKLEEIGKVVWVKDEATAKSKRS